MYPIVLSPYRIFILMRCPVFPFFLIFQHIQVRGVAGFADVMMFHCFTYSTSRFMAVGTVIIAAVGGNFEYFRKVMSYFFFFHIECSEAFDARSVDDIAVTRYREHLGESSGVHTFVVVGGDFTGFDVQLRQDGIDEGGLAHSGVAGEKRYFPFKFFLYDIEPSPVLAEILKQG